MSFLVQFSPISYTLMFFFPKQALNGTVILLKSIRRTVSMLTVILFAINSHTILSHMEEYRYTKAEKLPETAV